MTTDYGSGKCPDCGGDFKLKQDGTLRHHLGTEFAGRFRQVCKGAGRMPVPTTLGTEFPGLPGARWRDADGSMWVLGDDWQLRMARQPTAPQQAAKTFGPMTRVGGA